MKSSSMHLWFMQSYTPPKLALGSASGLVLVKYNVQGLLAMKTVKSSVWYLLQVSYGGLLMFMSFILLLPASAFTSLWHVASEQFNQPNPSSPVWIEYQVRNLCFSYYIWRLLLWTARFVSRRNEVHGNLKNPIFETSVFNMTKIRKHV